VRRITDSEQGFRIALPPCPLVEHMQIEDLRFPAGVSIESKAAHEREV
jgi:hypothetical protein